jgi:hypothetical protein
VGLPLATQLAHFGNTAEQPLGILLRGPAAGSGHRCWLAFRRYLLA